MPLPRIQPDARLRARFHGCLLGGAVGDALGAPVEFLDVDEIVKVYGEGGIRDYAPAYGKLGSITDDTQMTLFTAEGMLSAHLASSLQGQPLDFFRAATGSYARWLLTQENSRLISSACGKASWLLQQKKLFSRRAPGTTCLSALQTSRGKVARAANDSKGCGGVMRIAPVGMYFAHALIRERKHDRLIPSMFATGADLAAITHGHPSGCLTAGVLAVIIGVVLAGSSLKEAIDAAKEELRKQKSHKETLVAIERAEALAHTRPRERSALRVMGKGFVAEEALAMGIYFIAGTATRQARSPVISWARRVEWNRFRNDGAPFSSCEARSKLLRMILRRFRNGAWAAQAMRRKERFMQTAIPPVSARNFTAVF